MDRRALIPYAYWVEPGRLLAGAYPGAGTDEEVVPRLGALAEAGITSFVDLTEEDEGLPPYRGRLAHSVRYARMPIRDFGCPSAEEMRATLDLVDAELERGEVVYLHCRGGLGRTGTVVGCWLARHGRSGEEALARIAELRAQTPNARASSPETEAQRELVLGWRDVDS